MLHIHWYKKKKGESLAKELETFFSSPIAKLSLVKRSFSTVDLPNIQTALDHVNQSGKESPRILGYTSSHGEMQGGLRELISENNNAVIGPVQYQDVDTGFDTHIQCLENGILLLSLPEGKLAVHVRGASYMTGRSIVLEVMSNSSDLANRYIEEIRDTAAKQSVYRSKILSLECDADGWGSQGVSGIRFHHFPKVKRDEIILPEQTLQLIERNTLQFIKHADLLRKSGRSLKRGLLMHGRPGTGKTHTIRWLAQSLDSLTVILMSAEQLWLIKECCEMARMLAPSLVVLEDVDLVAAERNEIRNPMYQISLHQLLNEMDGLESESQVLFILTTNRPTVIEPALSLRPGRVDQAIEFPLPDDECRYRLFNLYSQGLIVADNDIQEQVKKTKGASPAFIKEFIRKASLIAADSKETNGDQLVVQQRHFNSALEELLLYGGEVTRNLLGFPKQ